MAAVVVLLGACASVPPEQSTPGTRDLWGGQGSAQPPQSLWQHYTLPGKTPVEFRRVQVDGREAVLATSDSAVSMLRQRIRIEPADLGRVRFSWKVPALIADADLGRRDKSDSPVRIVLAFDGDRSRLSARDAAMSELARALTGEEMPYATLMYVWCNTRAPGTILPNGRTSRIQKMVIESGSAHLNQWLEYERDIRADFERAFGEPPGALIGIALMTDSDNTQSRTRAWYGPATLVPVAAAR